MEAIHRPQRRVVIDTNVWLSAAISPNGAPAQVVDRLLALCLPVFSVATFAELEARIWKPKFDRYISRAMRTDILHDARTQARWVAVPASIGERRCCRDPDDDKFIHLAIAAQPAWLVTGDQDLLVLAQEMAVDGVTIVSPANALTAPELTGDD